MGVSAVRLEKRLDLIAKFSESADDDELEVVSGRRRERHRDANRYHRLMDMEWDTPIGEALACHGDAMMRVAFLRRAGLFDESLIAGEEPELCARLRAAGGRILRLPAEMSLHDVAIDSESLLARVLGATPLSPPRALRSACMSALVTDRPLIRCAPHSAEISRHGTPHTFSV